VSYQVSHNCPGDANFSVILRDKKNTKITENSSQNDTLSVSNPKLWWPRGSIKANGSYGYLHSLEFSMVCNKNGNISIDIYQISVGIRSINWSKTPSDIPSFTINNEPFYCKGVNKHEDFAVYSIFK
jgi:beta-galactosidase/beta-glucuronidase